MYFEISAATPSKIDLIEMVSFFVGAIPCGCPARSKAKR
mgnify:CR=1 FL=1